MKNRVITISGVLGIFQEAPVDTSRYSDYDREREVRWNNGQPYPRKQIHP